MIRKKTGFTLIEMLLTIVMSGLVIAAASSSFIGLMKQSRIQGGLAESNINLIGIDMLRRDIEGAGTGLTWDEPVPLAYSENESGANRYTDLVTVDDKPTAAPRAILSVNKATFNSPNNMFDGSDYLVIKSASVAGNDTSVRWSFVGNTNLVSQWTSSRPYENFQTNDRVVVLDPRSQTARPLINDSGAFYTTYSAGALANSEFAPEEAIDTYLVYGIAAVNPVRPFNRADYFIERPADMPKRCAPNTGILYKAVMAHDADGTLDLQPLVDCVADMQVIFSLDKSSDGYFEVGVGGDTYSDDIITAGTMSASDIRAQVKEVRVYILTHEGGKDLGYTHSPGSIPVGEFGLGHTVNLGTNLNYRWKIYQMIVKPFNLLQ